MITLATPIINLSTVRSEHAPRLSKLGLVTIEDILRHTPSRYDDFLQTTNLNALTPGNTYTIEGTVSDFTSKRSWKKKIPVTQIVIENAGGSVRAIWFGQRFLDRTLAIGKNVRISGKASLMDGEIIFSSPSFELASRARTHTGDLVPIYPETAGISSRWLRWQLKTIFKSLTSVPDPIPPEILETLHLPNLLKAFHYIHFPKTDTHWKVAEKRFAFEEMFLMQLKSLRVKNEWSRLSSPSIASDRSFQESIRSVVPFSLTNDQKKATESILFDLRKKTPMNRLLNGDVGSGKTIVAFLAMLACARKQYQSALLAPTEVLALQHFRAFRTLLRRSGITVALLTRSYQMFFDGRELSREPRVIKRSEIVDLIRSGSATITIGTHALLRDDIHFTRLALIVVDEQHRFGVRQRAYLQHKAGEINDGLTGTVPHFLTMTATPIPRTLAIAFFGSLDISLLETMPAGRKPIKTKIVPPRDRMKVHAFIRSEIQKGRQAYVILPLVDESDMLTNVKSATQEYEKLQKEVYPELALGLLHGKLPSKEKELVMQAFKENKIHILVATSVIEVGIDVPNATIMLIENAERFGLSQLHQFRGRVGRGEWQSYCFLFSTTSAPESLSRLKIAEAHQSGFDIAQKDLVLRGAGQFFGTKQSGVPDMAMEHMANIRLVSLAREYAEQLLVNDPELSSYPLLREALGRLEKQTHWE